MDQWPRTMHNILHPIDEKDCMCQKKREEDNIKNASIQGLEDNVQKSKEGLISSANSNISNLNTDRKTTETRKQK